MKSTILLLILTFFSYHANALPEPKRPDWNKNYFKSNICKNIPIPTNGIHDCKNGKGVSLFKVTYKNAQPIFFEFYNNEGKPEVIGNLKNGQQNGITRYYDWKNEYIEYEREFQNNQIVKEIMYDEFPHHNIYRVRIWDSDRNEYSFDLDKKSGFISIISDYKEKKWKETLYDKNGKIKESE